MGDLMRVCKTCKESKPETHDNFYWCDKPNKILAVSCRVCSLRQTNDAAVKAAALQVQLTALRCVQCTRVFPKTINHFNYRKKSIGLFDTTCRLCRRKNNWDRAHTSAGAPVDHATNLESAIVQLGATITFMRGKVDALTMQQNVNTIPFLADHSARINALYAGQAILSESATKIESLVTGNARIVEWLNANNCHLQEEARSRSDFERRLAALENNVHGDPFEDPWDDDDIDGPKKPNDLKTFTNVDRNDVIDGMRRDGLEEGTVRSAKTGSWPAERILQAIARANLDEVFEVFFGDGFIERALEAYTNAYGEGLRSRSVLQAGTVSSPS